MNRRHPRLISSISRQYSVNDPGGRTAIDQRQRHDLPAPSLDFALTDDVCGPIGAFDENVRTDLQDRFERSVLIESAHEIHHLHAAEQFRTFLLRDDGAAWPLHAAD